MTRSPRWIGFDRRLELSWLDFAARRVADGASEDEIRDDLLDYLQSLSHDPEESGSARPKTARVILRMWGGPDEDVAHLSASSARLFRSADRINRTALHWSVALAAYPYFFAHAEIFGGVLSIQDTVSAAQIRRRIAKRWGDRSTVYRTSRHVVRTMVAMECLTETGKGVYARPTQPGAVSTDSAIQLVKAVLSNADGGALEISQLLGHPSLFPFKIQLDRAELHQNEGLHLAQEGVGAVMVRLADNV